MTDIPDEYSRDGCEVCCVDGNLYLVGGGVDGNRVTEYNPRTNTWSKMPSFQQGRDAVSICTLDNKGLFTNYVIIFWRVLDHIHSQSFYHHYLAYHICPHS